MFPVHATYFCQPLPLVIGPTVSEYYELIWLPANLRRLFLWSSSPTLPGVWIWRHRRLGSGLPGSGFLRVWAQ